MRLCISRNSTVCLFHILISSLAYTVYRESHNSPYVIYRISSIIYLRIDKINIPYIKVDIFFLMIRLIQVFMRRLILENELGSTFLRCIRILIHVNRDSYSKIYINYLWKNKKRIDLRNKKIK